MCGTQGTDFRGSDSTIEEADHCYSGTARSSFCSHGRLELLSGTAVAKMATNMSFALQDMYYVTVASNAPPKMVNKQTLFSLHLLDTKYDTHEPKSSLALTTEASRSTRARGVAVNGWQQLIRELNCI